MKRSDAIRFVLLRSLGNFLLLMSIYGVIATFGPALIYEAQFQLIKIRGIEYQVARAEEAPGIQQGFEDVLEKTQITNSQPGFAEVLAGPKKQILVPTDTDFSITIPKIGASAKIFPNIDPSNEDEFLPVLQEGIAHARGTVFPGFAGNTYLFAHSTDNWWNVGRYNAVFYLLKNLEKGDEVTVFFENVRHDYIVTDSFVADADDVSLLVNAQNDHEQLVLQTCWPPGTTWKRQVIIATPK